MLTLVWSPRRASQKSRIGWWTVTLKLQLLVTRFLVRTLWLDLVLLTEGSPGLRGWALEARCSRAAVLRLLLISERNLFFSATAASI